MQVRVANASAAAFDAVHVTFPSGAETYGALLPGEASAYRSVEKAYRYAPVTVEAGGQQYTLQPTDYVGETPLAAGRYTYRLDLQEGALGLMLVRQ